MAGELCFIALYADGEAETTCPMRGGEGECSRQQSIERQFDSADEATAQQSGLDTAQDMLLKGAKLGELYAQAIARKCGGMVIEVEPTTLNNKTVCPTGVAMSESKPRRTALTAFRTIGKAIIRK